jgi:hypothetical protein
VVGYAAAYNREVLIDWERSAEAFAFDAQTRWLTRSRA